MIRIGASYYSGCPIPLRDFVSICADAALDLVEVVLEDPYTPEAMLHRNGQRRDDNDGDLGRAVRDTLASVGLDLALHAPIHDINLASLKEPIRRASVEVVRMSIDVAHRLQVGSLVVHCGKCPADQIARLDLARERLYASLLDLAIYAHARNVRLGLENKQRGKDRELILLPEEQRDIVNLLSDLGASAVVDVGHANTTGRDPAEFLDILSDYTTEVHVHDNDGTSDQHLAPGEGTLRLTEIMQRVRELDRDVIIEVKEITRIGPSAEMLRDWP